MMDMVRAAAPGMVRVGTSVVPSSDEMLRSVIATTPALVLIVDGAGRAVLTSAALERATGWSRRELELQPFWELLIAPEDVAQARDDLDRALDDGVASAREVDWRDRWGGRRRVASQQSVLRDAHDVPYALVMIGMDVTDLRRAEADLRERATTDVLTGLRNRSALFESLADALTRLDGTGCGLLFADLDGFKAANDRYGHHVGDVVLVEVAARLRRITGIDDVVARLGGDEFVVLCRGADPRRITRLVERLEAEMAEPIVTPHGSVGIGVSVGTAVGRPGQHPDEVVREADRRMYQVKAAHAAQRDAAERAEAERHVPLRGARFPRQSASPKD
jgi:diguanylate cyclase (GGDEF)-like protein/PAS domain S-box-containing protein